MLWDTADAVSRGHLPFRKISGHQFRKFEERVLFFLPLTLPALAFRSHVFVSAAPHQHDIPREPHYLCRKEGANCDDSQQCSESGSGDGSPQTLRDVIALFPRATDLTLFWEVSDDVTYNLEPTHFGDQVDHLKRLRIELDYDTYGAVDQNQQAETAQMLLDHLHMPSLESAAIDFTVSRNGKGYANDFQAIGKALCGIESSRLQRVSVSTTMAIWEEPVPAVWVSI